MHRLLIVDDEPSICFAVSDYFSSLGYEVHSAQQLEEAQALLGCGCYEAVITNLCLTGISEMGGMDVIKTVQLLCPGAKVIVLTGCSSEQVEAQVRRVGVDAYLHKTGTLSELAQVVNGLFSGTDV